MMYQAKEVTLTKLFIRGFLLFGMVIISAVSYGKGSNIPEFTAAIVDATDFDLTGHIIVITGRA